MLDQLQLIKVIAFKNTRSLLLFICAFICVYYGVSLVSLVVRFGAFPNYINFYDWLGNTKVIVQSTPSIQDMLMIIKDEWLMEVGYMNYDFGHGISEWSLFFVPFKVITVALIGLVLGLHFMMNRYHQMRSKKAAACSGIGASLVGLTSITFSWVVCCSTPTWVVGLAMLGLGVTTSLWLEPIGAWVSGVGFLLLTLGLLIPKQRGDTNLNFHSLDKKIEGQ